MYCENCGAEISNESAFCSKCGKPVQKKNGSDGQENLVVKENPLIDKVDVEAKKARRKGCLNVVIVLFVGFVVFAIAYVFYASSQGENKDAYACQLVSSLLRQNFGEKAAHCKSYTVRMSPEKGLWIPEIGIIIDGQDIGTAVLSNGTVINNILHTYRNGQHEVKVQEWSSPSDYMEKTSSPEKSWDY